MYILLGFKSRAANLYTLAINMRTSVQMIQMYYSDVVPDDVAKPAKGPMLSRPRLCTVHQSRCNLMLHLDFQEVMTEVVAGERLSRDRHLLSVEI